MKRKWKKPRQYSLVKYDFDAFPADAKTINPFKPGRVYVLICELANMPGHCVLADHKTGKIYSGYHIENFVELSNDDE